VLAFVNEAGAVLQGKLLEPSIVIQQAESTLKEPCAAPPDIDRELAHAIIEALEAHTLMSSRALNSASVKRGLKDILLNHAGLWEQLRERAAG
jgi:type I restriction enzyme R subunit